MQVYNKLVLKKYFSTVMIGKSLHKWLLRSQIGINWVGKKTRVSPCILYKNYLPIFAHVIVKPNFFYYYRILQMSVVTKGVCTFAIVMLCAVLHLQAKPVTVATAKVAATNQFTLAISKNKGTQLQTNQVVLAYEQVSTVSNSPLYYIFTPVKGKGFVIIAGDDAVQPILAWSDDGDFSLTNQPPAFVWFTQGYCQAIENVRANSVVASTIVAKQWNAQLSGDVKKLASLQSPTTVQPLVKAKWNQGDATTPYNTLCPLDAQANERAVTGCAATAFAMLLQYHGKPTQGFGFSKYTHATFGEQSANYGATQYNWGIMPLTDAALREASDSAKLAVATLMYHCGVSIDMNYGLGSKGGSGASPDKFPKAFNLYFGYKNTVRSVEKKDYTEQQWLDLVKGELNARRPMEYHGFGKGGGHSFVCDGYDADNKLHMNWGWGGQLDGYYAINNLVPGTGGTGAGSGSYTEGQAAIVGIEPDTAVNRNSIVMNRNTFVNYANLYRDFNFEITVAFSNVSATDFKGDMLVFLVDSAKNVVDTIARSFGLEIKAGVATGDLKLTSKTNTVVNPGNYFIAYGIVKDGNWIAIADVGQFKNYVPQAVAKPVVQNLAELGLNAAIGLSTKQVRIGSPVTVTLDVSNYSSAGNPYSGEIYVDLLTTNGTKVIEMGKKTEIADLALNAKLEGGVTVNFTPTATIKPGKYLVAAMAKSQFAGTANQFIDWRGFVNPVVLEILPTELKDDKNEPNNTKTTASSLPLKPNAVDSIVVEDANLDDFQDVDYYKVDFTAGKQYAVTVSIQDMTTNAETFTGEVAAYCDYMQKTAMYVDASESEVVNDTVSGTMYVEVEPKSVGQFGSYKLVVTYKELGPTSVNDDEELVNSVRVSPVPTSSSVSIRMNSATMDAVRVLNVLGETVRPSVILSTETEQRLDVSSLPAGMYFVHVNSGGKEVVKQFVVVK